MVPALEGGFIWHFSELSLRHEIRFLSNGAGMVSYGAGNVSHGVGKVSHGAKKLSHGTWK